MIKYHSLFVYETLLKNSTIMHALHHLTISTPAQLKHFTEVSRNIDGDDYHTIISKKNGKVSGKILCVSDEDLKKLDNWENKYERRKISFDAEGKKQAWVYVLKE